jgi:hypothetical protein
MCGQIGLRETHKRPSRDPAREPRVNTGTIVPLNHFRGTAGFQAAARYYYDTAAGRNRGNPGSMRALVTTAALLALAAWLDSSLFGGFYTHALNRMLSDIAAHFR